MKSCCGVRSRGSQDTAESISGGEAGKGRVGARAGGRGILEGVALQLGERGAEIVVWS